MLLNVLFVILGPVAAIAEYYNQHVLPYDVDGGANEAYSDYNAESSMISMSESNMLEGEPKAQGPAREVASGASGETEHYVLGPSESRSPAGAIKSLRIGKFKTNPESISELLHREMADMSPDLHSKLTTTLEHRGVDHRKYRDLFLIKKRVIDDGRRKIINFNIKEKIIPREGPEDLSISKDFGTRALLGGIMFLLAGLVFTTTLKMYQSLIRKNYFGLDDKSEMFTEAKQPS